MNTNYLIIVLVVGLSLFLVSGCSEDGDGKIVTEEPKKELSEIPQRKNWSVTDVEGYGE